MFLTFYSAFTQTESESIYQNVKIGLKVKMKHGELVGNCCGYFSTCKKYDEFIKSNSTNLEYWIYGNSFDSICKLIAKCYKLYG